MRGLHNSESPKGQRPQKSISFRCRHFVEVWMKFWNDNYLFEVEFLQHFLQLRKFSRAARKAFVADLTYNKGKNCAVFT